MIHLDVPGSGNGIF